MTTQQFLVRGDRAITETGLHLAKGDHVLVRHTGGTVRFNTAKDWGPEVGPNGYPRSDFNVHWPEDAKYTDPLTGWHDGHAGLMATVDGQARFVGAKATLASQLGCDLRLGINDATPDGPSGLGNSGGFEVTVEVGRPPRRLAPLLGTWVKVHESPRRSGAPDLRLMAFDLDRTWRALKPYGRELDEGGEIREVGSLAGRDFITLWSDQRREAETWVFEVERNRLLLERVSDHYRQDFDRL
ncbi:MAG: hypothetical protein KDK70_28755 [Myxococcales bacterium]|nr:hypothetical protein [Myxococcales bacterium]